MTILSVFKFFSLRQRHAVAFMLAAVALAALVAGCATTDESDIPWNRPQSWEGSPSIPGLNQD